MRKATQANKPDPDEEWLKRYEADRRSVFIGNLPAHMDNLEANIRRVFCEVGDVVQVNVIQRESRTGPLQTLLDIYTWICELTCATFPGGNRVNAFAFVEFTRPDMAEAAIHRMVSVDAFSNCPARQADRSSLQNNANIGGHHIRVERKSSRERQGPRTMHSNAALGGVRGGRVEDDRVPVPATPLRQENVHAGGPAGVNPMPGYVPPYANFPATPGTPGLMGHYYAGYAPQPMYHPGGPIVGPYLSSPPMHPQAMVYNQGPQQSPLSGPQGQASTPTRSAGRDEVPVANSGVGSSKSA